MNYVKIGLELHIQITDKKLFCRCSKNWTKTDNVSIVTLLTEPAPLTSTYLSDIRTCEYEHEDALPLPPSISALSIAKTVARDLNMVLETDYVVHRKYILDGSLTAGFQRTGIIARNGLLNGIPIAELRLEEDSAKRISQTTFHLARLGVPLLEIVTTPFNVATTELSTVVQILYRLSTIVRQYTSVRGIGTIRQDVNVHAGLGKTELKGFQDVRQNLKQVLKKEIERQNVGVRSYVYTAEGAKIKIQFKTEAARAIVHEYFQNIEFNILHTTVEARMLELDVDTTFRHNKVLSLLNRLRFAILESTRRVKKNVAETTFLRGILSRRRYGVECLITPLALKNIPLKNTPVKNINEENNAYLKLIQPLNLTSADSKKLANAIEENIKNGRIKNIQLPYLLVALKKNLDIDEVIKHEFEPLSAQTLLNEPIDVMKPFKQILYELSNKFRKNIVDYATFCELVRAYYDRAKTQQ